MRLGPDAPLSGPEFDGLLRPLGRFGPGARLAAAVSGGADSMALLLLLAEWADGAGARVAALTVDHGLRPGSAAEAGQVAAWCRARGIRHRILAWRGAKPAAGVQAAARAARHGLLADWCREHAHLHLVLAHHRGDQAETFLMRMGRGGGVDGLAGMAAASVRDGVRIVRPLLGVSRARLVATLRARGQPWLEDPSNRDPSHDRVRVRVRLAGLEAAGLPEAAVARTAAVFGGLRAARERAVAALAARAVAWLPEGYAEVAGEAFRAADEDAARGLLSSLLAAAGGSGRRPRRRRLERLLRELRGGGPERARTLRGCLVAPVPGGFRVCREPGGVAGAEPVRGRTLVRWDRRFDVRLRPGRLPGGGAPAIAALGDEGCRIAAGWRRAPAALPRAVRLALPALWAGGELVEAPHLAYARRPEAPPAVESVLFRPPAPMCGAPFAPAGAAGPAPEFNC